MIAKCTCRRCGQAYEAPLESRHRVLCGDATRQEEVERLLDGHEQVDVCLTDPPYGLGDSATAKNKYDVHDDSLEALKKLIAEFLPLARAKAKVVVLTPGNKNHRLYANPTWTMAWFVPAGTGRGPWGFCCWQPILCYGGDPKLATGRGSHPDAIVHTESAAKLGHPCSKPINFWTWLLERASEPGQTIYDPFVGSGTSVIAAERTGRKCLAIDLSPGYVDITIKRWQNYTGKLAVLEHSGKSPISLDKENQNEG